MTPCEKLGYKVGDRFVAQIDGYYVKKDDILTLVRDDGSRMPYFRNEKTQGNSFEYIAKYDDMCFGSTWLLPEASKFSTPKDPIEYLKSAHTDGDMIDPETMLRDCYGITKTERVVVEWSEVKREIKVGDKVRIVGNSNLGYNSIAVPFGSVDTVKEVDITDSRATYFVGDGIWFPASSVELV